MQTPIMYVQLLEVVLTATPEQYFVNGDNSYEKSFTLQVSRSDFNVDWSSSNRFLDA